MTMLVIVFMAGSASVTLVVVHFVIRSAVQSSPRWIVNEHFTMDIKVQNRRQMEHDESIEEVIFPQRLSLLQPTHPQPTHNIR